MKPRIAITGGCGFVGSYITKKFLEENYEVKVSVTDKSNTEKYEHIASLGHVTIEEMDARNYEAVTNFIEGYDNIVHCGSPFTFAAEDPQAEIIEPNVVSTRHILQACKNASYVKKLVIISSVAAINGYVPSFDPNKGEEHIFTEEDEPTNEESHNPYCQAKYQADQAVRAFIKNNPNLPFEIVTLYPGFVVGNPLSSYRESTSAGLLFLIKNKMTPNPMMEWIFQVDNEFAMVAVKDVAEAVYKMVILPNLHGKKYIISNETWRASDMSSMLNGKTPQGKSRIQYSNQKAILELGMQFTPAKVPLNEFGDAG